MWFEIESFSRLYVYKKKLIKCVWIDYNANRTESISNEWKMDQSLKIKCWTDYWDRCCWKLLHITSGVWLIEQKKKQTKNNCDKMNYFVLLILVKPIRVTLKCNNDINRKKRVWIRWFYCVESLNKPLMFYCFFACFDLVAVILCLGLHLNSNRIHFDNCYDLNLTWALLPHSHEYKNEK